MMNENEKLPCGDWILSDDESCQYTRESRKDVFECVEIRRVNENGYGVFRANIELSDYLSPENETDLNRTLSAFSYADIAQLKGFYGESWRRILAECIFEFGGDVSANMEFKGDEDECRKWIVKFLPQQRKGRNV